jgi:hypothetical protein
MFSRQDTDAWIVSPSWPNDQEFVDEAEHGKAHFANEALKAVVSSRDRTVDKNDVPLRKSGRRRAVSTFQLMSALVVVLPGGRARYRSADLTLFRSDLG